MSAKQDIEIMIDALESKRASKKEVVRFLVEYKIVFSFIAPASMLIGAFLGVVITYIAM